MRYSSILLTCGLVIAARNGQAQEPFSPRDLTASETSQVQASQPVESVSASAVESSAADCRDPLLMMGDVFTFCGRRRIIVPGVLNATRTTTVTTTQAQVVQTSTGFGPNPMVTTSTSTTSSTSTSTANLATALFRQAIQCNPYAGRAFFKISQNESPIPQTRFFVGYQYLDAARGDSVFLPGASSSSSSLSSSTSAPVSTTVITNDPQRETIVRTTTTTTTTTTTATATTSNLASQPVLARRVDGRAEVFGFEYALLDGDASIGLRAPIIQQHGDGSFGRDDFGDLSIIAKILLLSDADSGSGLSAGLMLTAPTGPDILTIRGNVNSTLFQPFVGGLFRRGNAFIQGFSSVILPANGDDTTLLLNSIGLGYEFRGSGIFSVAPVVELHVTTPLNNHGPFEAVHVPDIVNLTAGLQIGVGNLGLLTIGAVTPIVSDRQFDYGFVSAFNLRF